MDSLPLCSVAKGFLAIHREQLDIESMNSFRVTNFSKSFLSSYSFHYHENYCRIYVLLSYCLSLWLGEDVYSMDTHGL